MQTPGEERGGDEKTSQRDHKLRIKRHQLIRIKLYQVESHGPTPDENLQYSSLKKLPHDPLGVLRGRVSDGKTPPHVVSNNSSSENKASTNYEERKLKGSENEKTGEKRGSRRKGPKNPLKGYLWFLGGVGQKGPRGEGTRHS